MYILTAVVVSVVVLAAVATTIYRDASRAKRFYRPICDGSEILRTLAEQFGYQCEVLDNETTVSFRRKNPKVILPKSDVISAKSFFDTYKEMVLHHYLKSRWSKFLIYPLYAMSAVLGLTVVLQLYTMVKPMNQQGQDILMVIVWILFALYLLFGFLIYLYERRLNRVFAAHVAENLPDNLCQCQAEAIATAAPYFLFGYLYGGLSLLQYM